ncbi:neutral zinc metallopeptidase [Microbacterium oryzae]|uniref:Neutral zinc metallopeptidase n=1 Tax=Microbacterium oryzae TaxID=743009 RepID=A0A6I6E1S7_9MICO|nr:neutral zinc metallopeptidase [Microbacterium oryzae]QGU27839.1 neutral zinc metallopeptidase [Microbacterium oryzae]
MTFNDNADVSRNRARRRGRTTAIAGGGTVGVLGLGFLLLNLLTGGDLSALLGGLGQQQAAQGGGGGETVIADCQTGRDANENDDCRLAAGSLALDEFWGETVEGYQEPDLIIVDGQASTSCGTASNATGPFYCPPDRTVYIDPTFFSLLRERYDAEAGDLAQLYVLAHEYGHHVQGLTGALAAHQGGGTGADSDSVRTELQADCYAGVWIGHMAEQEDDNGVAYLQAPTAAQMRDAIDAAAAVGDDHIQQQSGGAVDPDSWSHGSSEQRTRWFQTGYEGGVNACDTFAVPGSDL